MTDDVIQPQRRPCHGTNGNWRRGGPSLDVLEEALAGQKSQFNSSALENKIPCIESFCRMPSWTEVCEAALGRSQQAVSDITVTCSGIVVSWKRIESTMMRFVLCSACGMPSGSAVAAPRMKLFTDTLLKQFIDAHTIPPSDRRILRVRRSEWRDVFSVVELGP